MKRYTVNMFDNDTFQVIDQSEQREICVCSNFADFDDAKKRANKIAVLLNQHEDILDLTSKTKDRC